MSYSMGFKCEFCSSIFTRECNLVAHKKSAKYCLDLQGKIKNENKSKCDKCGKLFVHTSSMIKHKKECTGKISKDKVIENLTLEKIELEEKLKTSEETRERLTKKVETLKNKVAALEEEVSDLRLNLAEGKGKISVYKERPNTNSTINNYINPKLLQIKCNTIRPFTIETVREDIQAGKFTFDRFIQAEKGLLEFISDIIAKDTEFSYVCTDSSRQKFHRLLESREWKDDNGATFLNKVLDELKEPTTEYYKRITDMMVNGDRDTADFLRNKTKPMVMGITCPRSKDREATFTKVRNEVKKLATI